MFDIKHLENDQIYKWNTSRDHDLHMKKLGEIENSQRKFTDQILMTHMKNLHQAKESARKMELQEKNTRINRTNQLLFEKIIEISQGKTEDAFKKKSLSQSTFENIEPTLHYYYRKREAERIAEENESLAKRIIQQPATLKRSKMNKDISKYLETRYQMQKFKNYFAEPPKKRKFRRRKILLPPLQTLPPKTIEPEQPTENLEKTQQDLVETQDKTDINPEITKLSDQTKIDKIDKVKKNQNGTILITPKNAELQIEGDLIHEMETLIRIKLWDQIVKTNTSKLKGKSPVWNQNLSIIKKNDNNCMAIELWQNDEWSSHNYLGSCEINLDEIEFFNKKKIAKWCELFNKEKNIGKVLVNIEWKTQNNEKKNVERELSPQLHNKKLKESEDKINKGIENKQKLILAKKSGMLIIRPKEIEFMNEILPESSKYSVKISLEKENSESQIIIPQNNRLKLIQSLTLKRKSNENDLKIEVWDKDPISTKCLTSLNVNLAETNIFLEKKIEKWWDLLKDSNKFGKILLELEWKELKLLNSKIKN